MEMQRDLERELSSGIKCEYQRARSGQVLAVLWSSSRAAKDPEGHKLTGLPLTYAGRLYRWKQGARSAVSTASTSAWSGLHDPDEPSPEARRSSSAPLRQAARCPGC